MADKIPLPAHDETFAEWIRRLRKTCTFVTLTGDWFDIETWCYNHSSGCWNRTHGNSFVFESAEDAMMASLVWS